MPRPSPVEVVRFFLDARDAGDPDVAVRVVHPAAAWESSVHGEVRGRQAIRRALIEPSEDTVWFRSRVATLHEHGRLVIASVQDAARADGDRSGLQALVFRVQDGLITNVSIVPGDPRSAERSLPLS